VRDQIHAPTNLSPEPIGKAQSRARRCDEKLNLFVSLRREKLIALFCFFTKSKNKAEVQGRLNDLLLHILMEMGLKLGQESIEVKRTSVDFLRPYRQIFG
jgi:hypothetical protein